MPREMHRRIWMNREGMVSFSYFRNWLINLFQFWCIWNIFQAVYVKKYYRILQFFPQVILMLNVGLKSGLWHITSCKYKIRDFFIQTSCRNCLQMATLIGNKIQRNGRRANSAHPAIGYSRPFRCQGNALLGPPLVMRARHTACVVSFFFLWILLRQMRFSLLSRLQQLRFGALLSLIRMCT